MKTEANRRSLPKLKNHPGAKAEAKAARMNLSQKVVAKFLGVDVSYITPIYRGYQASHAGPNGEPPAEAKPLSPKMAERVAAFLSKAADAELKELAAKYPQGGSKAVAADPNADVPVIVEGKPGKRYRVPPAPKAAKKASKRKVAKKAAPKPKRQAVSEPQPVA